MRTKELLELLDLLLRDRQELPGLRVLLFRATPRIQRVAAIETTGDTTEFFLHRSELAQRDRQKALVAERDAVFELQLLFEALLAEAE